MIKLRLRRMGTKKRPTYRIVAADSRSPRDGRIIESFGYYNPVTDPATIRVDPERARHWLSVGAQPTDTVRDILRREGLLAGAGGTPAMTTDTSAGAVPPGGGALPTDPA